MRSPDPERARRVIALQALGGALAGVALSTAVVLGVVLVGQHRDMRAQLHQLVTTAPTTGLPAGTWVVTVGAGDTRRASPGAPPGQPRSSQVDAARRSPSGLVEEVVADGREYQTLTQEVRGTVVQAGIDVSPYEGERHRLLVGLLLAAVAAALLAWWLGTRLARMALAAWEEALARQRRFVADVSHELRTPLARIALRADLVGRRLRGPLDERTAPAVGREVGLLHHEATGLADVVEDLLAASDLDQSADAGELVDVGDLVRDAVIRNEVLAAHRGVGLAAEVGETPPVRGAEPALRRALDALLDNALRHAEHRVVVTVTADAAPPGVGGRVVVAVQDDGPGLTGTAAGDAFGRGARGPGSAAGHGIGLALVREVVERHEGTVRVDPAPDGGARFVLELPAQG